jgi:hypothetical protein
MRLGELIPISHKLAPKGSVPAGKAKTAELGVIGVSVGIGQPTGETSKSTPPMPKYKTLPGQKQGTPFTIKVKQDTALGGTTPTPMIRRPMF